MFLLKDNEEQACKLNENMLIFQVLRRMIFSIPVSSSNKKRDVKVGFWWCWGLGCETFPVLDVFVMTFLDLIWDVETLSQWQSPPTIYVYGYSDLELDLHILLSLGYHENFLL